jgi:hypothetical protein
LKCKYAAGRKLHFTVWSQPVKNILTFFCTGFLITKNDRNHTTLIPASFSLIPSGFLAESGRKSARSPEELRKNFRKKKERIRNEYPRDQLNVIPKSKLFPYFNNP